MLNKDEYNRTIESVLNLHTGEIVNAEQFFQQEEKIIWQYREKCQEAIKGISEPVLVCSTCGQLIQISGGKGINRKITFFKHLKDSNDCPIKTDSRLSKFEVLKGKFNGQKEGKLHIEIKNLIAQFLVYNMQKNKGITSVDIEKINRDNRNYLEWKKPDISTTLYDKRLVFEIQLSTTFLDVICERQRFYKQNSTYILWVFRNFDIELDKQRFTQKDVFYSNNRNAFILDKEAIELSIQNKNLYMLCQYQRPIREYQQLRYIWESKYVNLDDLTFDTNFKVYYFNVDQEEIRIKNEIKLYSNSSSKLHIKNFDLKKEETQIKKEEAQTNFTTINNLFLKRLQKYDNKSLLLKIILESKVFKIEENIRVLFSKGYKPTKEDYQFIKHEYNIELHSYLYPYRYSALYLLSFIVFQIKLEKKPEYLKLFPKVERALCAILSIREDKIIGFEFNNLIGIVNYFFNPKGTKSVKEFAYPVLQAIKKYYGYDRFLIENKNNIKLKEKIEAINSDINLDYKGVINTVFDDLL